MIVYWSCYPLQKFSYINAFHNKSNRPLQIWWRLWPCWLNRPHIYLLVSKLCVVQIRCQSMKSVTRKVVIKDLYFSQISSHCAFFAENRIFNHNFFAAIERLHYSASCKKITNVITVQYSLLSKTLIFSNNVT